ncbi:MAG TPA: hypothetical protein VGN32_08270, partial [Ktedonobacterales bacterium]|nr:hypothetical protein [Ktedonobacterales bacterium]
MADTDTHEHLAQQVAQRVAERRKALGTRASLDPRVRALSQSGARHLLPPRPQPTRATIPMALFAVLGVLALLTCVGMATAVVYAGAWLQGTLNDPST